MFISRLLGCVVGIFLFSQSLAQEFRNIRTRVDDEKIIIIYDLESQEVYSKVMVRIYSSYTNFSVPLENVTGDVGLVTPGPNRRITWNAGELSKKIDSLTFQLKGEIIYILKFISPSTNSKLKRGTSTTIRWQGGNPTQNLKISLISPKNKITHLATTSNSGRYTWVIPQTIKTGAGYYLKLTEEGVAGEDTFIEQRVSIKRRFPLAVYGIPILGAAVYLLIKSGDSDDEKLPDAPKPG